MNWQTKNIEDCIDKIAYTNKIQRKDFLESGIFPIISQEQDLINGYWNKKEDVFHSSKPVVVFGDHTQILKYIDFDFVLGADGVKLLQPKDFLYPKYFYYFLQSINLRSLGYARYYRLLKEKDISYPESISEQKKITKKLEEIFEKLEKAKENTEKNLQNSKELFESYLNDIFSNPGKDWEESSLNKITSKIGSGATPNGGEKSYKEQGISLIRSLNIHDNGFRYKDLAHIDDDQATKLNNVIVECDDVLLNITGASIARCCIVPRDVLPARVNQHVSIIRTDKNKIESEFLRYILISKFYKDILLGIGKEKGVTRQALTKSIIKNFFIKFPKSFQEQKRIVKILDQLSEKTQKLESIYKQKLESIEELKKSILQKAFSGGL